MFENFYKFLYEKNAISLADYKEWSTPKISEAQVRCIDGKMSPITETNVAMSKGFIVFYKK